MSDKKAARDSVLGLPLVIGVTGHRDLRAPDRKALESSVEAIFSAFRKDYPNTPLMLLSPLADGADRLVARVALDSGLSLIVPLPMPRTLYETDFETAESKAEFRSLLERAETVFTLSPFGDYTEDEIRERGPSRTEQYAQVGAYIARHSHILIALWDEVPSEKVGGTAQIVKFRLEGVPEPYGPRHTTLDLVASGPLYHIATPRESNPNPAGVPGELRKLFPKGYETDEAAEAAYHLIFLRMDQFNRDSRRLDSKLAASRQSSKEYLFSGNRESLADSLKLIMERYAAADSLAIYFQRWTIRILRTLFLLVFVGVCFFQAYSDIRQRVVFLLVYMSLLGVAYIFYALAKRNEYHGKYLDYRALAEGMRVQFFWLLAGLKKPVADYYLRKQRSELDWIRKAIRVWTLSMEFQEAPNKTVATSPHQLRLVLNEWVTGQRRFFANAAKRDQRKLKWQKRFVRLFFLISVALTATQTVLQIYQQASQGEDWLIFSMGLALVIAGLLAGYGERRALAEQIRQYAQMATIFANAEQRLTELLEKGEQAQALELLEELGKEALGENGDWVILHRERAVEVPSY
ncbi:MAG TPA: hypothetical protein VF131_26200 [Blastocatellia bacterium]|nr:hypothetical protein [Blastocatellia bacterium]